jgi:hypothetical protein
MYNKLVFDQEILFMKKILKVKYLNYKLNCLNSNSYYDTTTKKNYTIDYREIVVARLLMF